jgi:hypothetical protein
VAQEIREYCARAYDLKECEKVAEAEQALILKHAKFVKRVGRSLEFTSVKGPVLKLSDTLKEEGELVAYTFKDYIPEIDSFLVQVNYSEGGSYALVNRYAGFKIDIDTPPIFSPDHEHFITSDICPSYCQYRLQIWQRSPREGFPLELVWSYTPYDSLERIEPQWLNNKTIKLTKSVYKDANEFRIGTRTAKKVAYLYLDDEGWRILDQLSVEK